MNKKDVVAHVIVTLIVLGVVTGLGMSGHASSDFIKGVLASYVPAIAILTWSDWVAYGRRSG